MTRRALATGCLLALAAGCPSPRAATVAAVPPDNCSGEAPTQACGCGGTQTQACDEASGTWTGAWGPCSGALDGVCACPGSAPVQACGDCGVQIRECNLTNGTWTGAWSGWLNEGECDPGSTQTCDSTGIQTCSDSCSWGTCGNFTCTGAPPTQACGSCGTQGETCNTADGTWTGGWGPCYGSCPSTTPPDSGPPYPIVLMHGMGGFNELENLPFTVSYFSGVQADLIAHGYTNVFVTITSPFDTSQNRAAILAPQIQAILAQTGKAKVNLIAHSQGGLDARILASPAGFNMGNVIASVTTVSTPHRGTPLADLGLGLLSGVPSSISGPVTDAFLQVLEDGVYPVQSNPNLLAQINEMTTSYMANTFNPTYVDAPGVVYASYGGRTNLESGSADCGSTIIPNVPSDIGLEQVYFVATAGYMQTIGLENDGLVPIESAEWDTFMQCVPADHLQEVGMLFQPTTEPISGFNHLVFFENIVARLQAEGF